jgi:hypothetical protein
MLLIWPLVPLTVAPQDKGRCGLYIESALKALSLPLMDQHSIVPASRRRVSHTGKKNQSEKWKTIPAVRSTKRAVLPRQDDQLKQLMGRERIPDAASILY